ncbi:MAG: hypothetical protein ACI85U_003598 [Candidatus Promineifilaceae bacterium]|jgi:hypothetical protein
MNNNSSNIANHRIFTEEDQLTLLKNSVDLRFTSSENNKITADTSRQSEFYNKKPKPITLKHIFKKLELEELQLEEQKKVKRNIRYICCVTIWVSLFTPFLNLIGVDNSILGFSLIPCFLGLFSQSFTTSSWIIPVVAYPLILFVYAGFLAFAPAKLRSQQLSTRSWCLTTGSGILYFFAALILFAADNNIDNAISTIGFGYYLSMATIFAYYFLTQFADRQSQL